jgi:general stress protein 26
MRVYSFAEIEDEFLQRVHSMVWCSAATLDTQNRLRSRILHPIWQGATGWVCSRRHSLKATHLAHNPHMSLAYIIDIAKPVYVDCEAEWADDVASKQAVWEIFRAAGAPIGYDPGTIWKSVEDADFGVVKLNPWRVELFDIGDKEKRKEWVR